MRVEILFIQLQRVFLNIVILYSSSCIPMNSPTNNFGYIHEARYMPRQNPSSNIYLVKNPVLISHPTLNNHTASYGTIPHVQTTPKIA